MPNLYMWIWWFDIYLDMWYKGFGDMGFGPHYDALFKICSITHYPPLHSTLTLSRNMISKIINDYQTPIKVSNQGFKGYFRGYQTRVYEVSSTFYSLIDHTYQGSLTYLSGIKCLRISTLRHIRLIQKMSVSFP